MSNVSVLKIPNPETAPTLFEGLEALFDDVRKHAFDLFQRRGEMDGWDVDDWFRAENDLIFTPKSELAETDKEFEMKVEVPAMEAKDLRISALPDAIIVQAETSAKEDKKEGKVHYSELSQKKLFRRFEFPVAIDVEQVKATLDKGMLRIVAAKLPAAEGKQIPVAA
jgi:HSP20 family molecular chaperone IbpA